MKKTTIEALAREDAFRLIGKEWMLVTGGTLENGYNTMTASWGGIGWLWNKPVAFVFIRPERYTYDFVEHNDYLTLSFLGMEKEMREALNLCGTVSGRERDKVAECGLTPVATEHGAVAFEQARLVVEGRKLMRTEMKAENFLDKEVLARWYNDRPGGSLHTVYVVEIENVYE